MTNKTDKIKKTYYIENDIVKKIKIKSALEEATETETINIILKEYFSKKGDKYLFQ